MALEFHCKLEEPDYRAITNYLREGYGSEALLIRPPMDINMGPIGKIVPIGLESIGDKYNIGSGLLSARREYPQKVVRKIWEALENQNYLDEDSDKESPFELCNQNGDYLLLTCNANSFYLDGSYARPIEENKIKGDIDASIELLELVTKVLQKELRPNLSLNVYFELQETNDQVSPNISPAGLFSSGVESRYTLEPAGNLTFEDIGGCEEAKRELFHLINSLKNPGIYREEGADPIKGILLYGPPGTGKTILAKAVANMAKANMLFVDGSNIREMWYGKSEQNIRALFDYAEKNQPSIVFLDEMDSIARSRDYSHEASVGVVDVMLSELDGLKSRSGVSLIGTTNRLEAIDEGFKRPGRFDSMIYISLPEEKDLAKIYEIQCRNINIDKEAMDYFELAQNSRNFSGADVYGVVQKAARERVLRRADGEVLGLMSTEDILEVIGRYITEKQGIKKIPESMYI